MTIAQFKKWLEFRIEYMRYLDEWGGQDDHMYAQGFIDEAYDYAIDLQLPDAAAACRKGPITIRLLECLNAIPETQDKQVYSLKEAADYLGYSESGLRKVVRSKRIRFAQIGQGPIKFQREWLNEFVKDQQSVNRSPAQKRQAPIEVEPNHGFDPAFIQADSQSGSK